ncbi:unnamed protein product [Allacma fusca]|uniref:C2H2-type domain-containing protein n=1 Tax=Allacma fusca TaxID=39272 RepID=A0A8J2ME77_9HEXA|nr:unnamed protein product [Allacma fusca]
MKFDPAKKNISNRHKFILQSFCRYFQMKLPLAFVKWDLTQEHFPFCEPCQKIAERLVKLNRQLEILKGELKLVESLVRSKINKISTKYQNVPKTWASPDSRIQTVRDVIMGPRIELTRASFAPVTDSVVIKVEPLIFQDDAYEDFDCFEENVIPEGACDGMEETSPGKIIQKKQTKVIRKRTARKRAKVSKVSTKNSKRGRKIVGGQQSGTSDCHSDGNELLMNVDMVQVDPGIQIEEQSDVIPEKQSRRCAQRSSKIKTKFVTNFRDLGAFDEPTDDCNYEDESDLHDEGEFEDDPRDEDFVLPDDAEDTLAVDSKLNSRIEGSLRANVRRKEEIPVPKSYYVPKVVTRLEGDKYLYKEHKFRGNKTYGFKCCECSSGHVFRKRKQVLLHIREVHTAVPGSSICPTCGKSFSSVMRMRSHKRVHDVSDAVASICELCGKDFKGEQALKHHIAFVHEKESTEMCEICGKKFKTKTMLKAHVTSVHFQEKICFCEICGKGFRSKSSLKMHLQSTHDTESRFACDYCGQRFRRKPHWKRHVQQFHSEPPQIKAARESVPADEEISVDNEEEAVGDVSLRCKYCGKQYNRHNNLTRHLLQIHHINVKGLSWKQGAPRKLLAKVTPQPDAVVKNSLLTLSQSSILVTTTENPNNEERKESIEISSSTTFNAPEQLSEMSVPTVDEPGRVEPWY